MHACQVVLFFMIAVYSGQVYPYGRQYPCVSPEQVLHVKLTHCDDVEHGVPFGALVGVGVLVGGIGVEVLTGLLRGVSVGLGGLIYTDRFFA